MTEGTQASVSINTGDEGSKGPSIEESFQALVEEGLIADEGEASGDDDAGTANEDEGSNDDRPDWLPKKFKTVEDFLKSHEELERKLGSGGAKKKEDETPAENSGPTEEQRKAANEATTKAGVDLKEVSQQFISNGELDADTYAKLEAAGYPREMVDVYAEGLMNRLNATTTEAYEVVGGEQEYGEMLDWAIANLSDAEQDAFDRAVNSNNKATAMFAIKGLKASYDAAVAEDASEEPEEQVTRNGPTSSSKYEHMDDYMADLDDPRYDTNETYRKNVMAKLARSNIM